MSLNLFVSPSPHAKGEQTSRRIMGDVLLALLPSLIISTIYFGVSALVVTAVAVASCVLFESLIRHFLMGERGFMGDLSPVVTGVLLAFNVPASLPLWIVVIGSFVAIVIAKMTFGGLGKNPFNPALVGRVFLLIAYPVQMTQFPAVEGIVDGFSGATPLAALKSAVLPKDVLAGADTGFSLSNVSFQDMLFGSIPGSLGEVASLLLIFGGLYLIFRKVITWHTPVAVLLSMVAVAVAYGAWGGYDGVGVCEFATFHILAGGALLGAVFMATDYATSPMTHKGMLIYGVGIGVLTMLIRLFGSYPEGMSFAILIMNSCVPLINKYVKPRRFGVK
ncbi:MAG: RnfABCDGE type electron transport complex subunit D [Rikenellaceae bacterium]